MPIKKQYKPQSASSDDPLTGLWQEWKAHPKDDEAYNSMYAKLKPTVSSAIRSFGGGDNTLELQAKVIVRDAVDTYDPTKQTNLKTHVYNHLHRLSRVRAQRSRAIHIPERTRLDANRMYEVSERYKEDHGYDPDDASLSDLTGLSFRRIRAARMDAEASEDMGLSEMGDSYIGGATNETDRNFWADAVYFDLGPVDRKIYEWTTGYNGHTKLPKQEIARRLRISPPAVSQRVGNIINKLQGR